MTSVMDVFSEFPADFQNSYVKEQLYFHAVGTLEGLVTQRFNKECFKFSTFKFSMLHVTVSKSNKPK